MTEESLLDQLLAAVHKYNLACTCYDTKPFWKYDNCRMTEVEPGQWLCVGDHMSPYLRQLRDKVLELRKQLDQSVPKKKETEQ